jgi:hypothetical protein
MFTRGWKTCLLVLVALAAAGAHATRGVGTECEKKCKKYHCISRVDDWGGGDLYCGKYEPWVAHQTYWCKACHSGNFQQSTVQSFIYKCTECDPDCEPDPSEPSEAQGCDGCTIIINPLTGQPVTANRNDCVGGPTP